MSKELTKENKQVAYKQQKKCLISLFGETQMKAHNDITRHIHQNQLKLERHDKTIFIKCGATGFLLNC